jgi:hypothetical protein
MNLICGVMLSAIGIVLLLAIITNVYDYLKVRYTRVNPGDIFYRVYTSRSPWAPDRESIAEVTDVKDGWVQYMFKEHKQISPKLCESTKRDFVSIFKKRMKNENRN